MNSVLIAISTCIVLISPLIYARAILRGKAKPHRTTRLVLLIITALATASLFAQHDRVAIWLAGASTLQASLIFYLSIKRGMGGWSKSDIICLLIAVLGIFLWQTTQNPLIALYAAIISDFTGMVPALVKTYKYPETEIASYFLLDVVAGTLSLTALSNWNIANYAYPLYIVGINAVMVILIRFKLGKRLKTL